MIVTKCLYRLASRFRRAKFSDNIYVQAREILTGLRCKTTKARGILAACNSLARALDAYAPRWVIQLNDFAGAVSSRDAEAGRLMSFRSRIMMPTC